MSLYSDLNEVLTPYAQRIKGLGSQISEVNESLGDVKADLDVKSDDIHNIEKVVGIAKVFFDIRIHAGTGKWITDNGYIAKLYPIKSGDVVSITAKVGYSSYYTVLASSSHIVGKSVDFATGYSSVIKIIATNTDTFTAPDDAEYLLVYIASPSPNIPKSITINGHDANEAFCNRVSVAESKITHIDENTYAEELNTINDMQSRDDNSITDENQRSMLKYKNGQSASSQRIIFSDTGAKKQIFHLHKRQNDGYDSGNNVYLPNAQSDFSDLRVIADNGEYLPYHIVYRGNIDILQDSRLGLNSNSKMYQNTHGTIIGMVNGLIRKSDDDGETWSVITALSSFNARPRVLCISAQDTLFFERAGVLYRSPYPYDSYAQVYDHTAGKTGPNINGYGFVEHPNGALIFGAYQTTPRVIEIFKSTDDGLNWTRVYYQETTYQHVHSMYVDTNQTPVAVYAGLDGGGGVLKSVDGGDTWTDLRATYSTMPKTTDYGVIYAGNGVRLLGGETGVVGGHSIIRTTDDSAFTPVLSIGNGFMRGEKLGNILFMGGTGANYFTNAVIMISEDNGRTFKQVFTSPDVKESGVTDGYKYVSKLTDANDSEYLIITNQHTTLPPVRIFNSGNNYYAEIIVDVPDGCEYVDFESGYLLQNRTVLYNEYNAPANKLLDFGLNEGECIKEGVSGYIYHCNFRYLPFGKNLCNVYPFISKVIDSKSIALDSIIGSVFSKDINFTTLSGITIEFWFSARSTIDVNLLKFGIHTVRFKGYSLYDNNTSIAVLRGCVNDDTICKADIVFDFVENEVTTYINGVQAQTKTDTSGIINAIKQWNGNVQVLEVNACSEYDRMQNFVVYSRVLTLAEIKNGYVCGLTQ